MMEIPISNSIPGAITATYTGEYYYAATYLHTGGNYYITLNQNR